MPTPHIVDPSTTTTVAVIGVIGHSSSGTPYKCYVGRLDLATTHSGGRWEHLELDPFLLLPSTLIVVIIAIIILQVVAR
jgi:hypothetical protein